MSHANQQTIDTYNSSVEEYVKTSPQKVDGDLKSWIDANLTKIDKEAKILELGSGTGKDAEYFESRGYTLELTDASKSFVEFLKKKGRDARLLDVLKDDIGKGYDSIFADAVLLHFNTHELGQILNKVHAALKDKGLFFFTLKCGDGEEVTDRKLHSNRYFKYWQPNEITEKLQSSGFGAVEITTVDDYRKDGRPDWLLISAEKVAR